MGEFAEIAVPEWHLFQPGNDVPGQHHPDRGFGVDGNNDNGESDLTRDHIVSEERENCGEKQGSRRPEKEQNPGKSHWKKSQTVSRV